MEIKELLALGFVDSSYTEEGENFTEYKYESENFIIEVYGLGSVSINFAHNGWVDVPNCNTIEDIKHIIRLFS